MNEAENSSVKVHAHSLPSIPRRGTAGSCGNSEIFWRDAGLFPRATTPISSLLTVHRYSNLCKSPSTSVAPFLFILVIPVWAWAWIAFLSWLLVLLSQTNKSFTLLLRKKHQFRSAVCFCCLSFCCWSCVIYICLIPDVWCNQHSHIPWAVISLSWWGTLMRKKDISKVPSWII